MLRVAIIGCGKIADQHVHAMNRVGDCQVVGLCDQEVLMARQLGERIGVTQSFADPDEMLKTVKPDVVHITTPPQSHFLLGRLCLESGSHVYLEKPFTVTAPDTEALIALTNQRGLKITAGHNYQFTLEMMQMRRLVREGSLGGTPVHLESHWSYELGDSGYVGPVLGNRNHWVRQLPGQLFHNVISHGIAKLAEFLDDGVASVVAQAHQSPAFAKLGADQVKDELRVLIRDRKGTTAFFCFSTQYRPALNRLRIYGPENSLSVDIINGTCIRNDGRSMKSYLAYFVPTAKLAKEYLRATLLNVTNFARRQLHQDFGMKELIGQFYASIRNGGPPPIPYREIILTARIMDEIFAQVYPVRGPSPVDRSQESDVRSPVSGGWDPVSVVKSLTPASNSQPPASGPRPPAP